MTSDKMELYPLHLPEELLYLPYEFSFLHGAILSQGTDNLPSPHQNFHLKGLHVLYLSPEQALLSLPEAG